MKARSDSEKIGPAGAAVDSERHRYSSYWLASQRGGSGQDRTTALHTRPSLRRSRQFQTVNEAVASERVGMGMESGELGRLGRALTCFSNRGVQRQQLVSVKATKCSQNSRWVVLSALCLAVLRVVQAVRAGEGRQVAPVLLYSVPWSLLRTS